MLTSYFQPVLNLVKSTFRDDDDDFRSLKIITFEKPRSLKSTIKKLSRL